jgi:hypothetical protein
MSKNGIKILMDCPFKVKINLKLSGIVTQGEFGYKVVYLDRR